MTITPLLAWPEFFAAAVAFCVVVYVLADGFDLGVGILFPLAASNEDRDLMMASIEPVWDGNETWLVMGGVLLLAAFPAGYYVLLPAFYLPVMFMLFALVGRGIAFGFRLQSERFRRLWDFVFAGGSLLATLCQGLILGGLINGVTMRDGMFAGSALDVFSILGFLCGAGLVGGYALLGTGWLIWKTEGSTQLFARTMATYALALTTIMMVIVSLWSAWSVPEVAQRWFAWPNIAYLAPIPVVTALLFINAWRGVWSWREGEVFLSGVVIFLLGFVGLVVSLWPYVVPRLVTIWDGASDPRTLGFVGVGVAIIIPIVLAYQAHAYWVFRGKARPLDGYGEATRALREPK